jgi:steroid 5-alpha reductase family enzyme
VDASIQEIALLLAANLGVALAAVILLWLVSIPLRDVSIIDMFFAVILFAVAAASYLLAEGVAVRKQLIVVLVGILAARITIHLMRRNWGHGEDPRYSKLRTWVANDRSFVWLSLKKVFLLQGIVLWFVSLPIQVAQVYTAPAALGLSAYLGIVVWVVGFFTETIADLQLTRFRADPANKGTVLQTGLWRYSRHPNYFGELCVWWGLFLIACDNLVGILTIIGPILYTHLIVNVTGQATLDKKLARERPGYKDYMQRTSGLIPLPPRGKKVGP